jgi:hypothetical protein
MKATGRLAVLRSDQQPRHTLPMIAAGSVLPPSHRDRNDEGILIAHCYISTDV